MSPRITPAKITAAIQPEMIRVRVIESFRDTNTQMVFQVGQTPTLARDWARQWIKIGWMIEAPEGGEVEQSTRSLGFQRARYYGFTMPDFSSGKAVL